MATTKIARGMVMACFEALLINYQLEQGKSSGTLLSGLSKVLAIKGAHEVMRTPFDDDSYING